MGREPDDLIEPCSETALQQANELIELLKKELTDVSVQYAEKLESLNQQLALRDGHLQKLASELFEAHRGLLDYQIRALELELHAARAKRKSMEPRGVTPKS